jgi:hypothetical protein
MTKVMNLNTGDFLFYTRTPVQSVILAHQQDRGNYNWWMREYWDIPVLVGKLTVSCGDFCAFRRRPRKRRS